ncbi:MAG TPA: amino acid racemase [Kofleriaceae bacterium]|jgi:aspartate racemase
MLHIGIVGCSAEGAALCYRTICNEAPALVGVHAHPEITLHTHSLALYLDAIERNDLDRVATLMLASAEKLERAGASFLICPDNTIHTAFDRVSARSPLPWLHIADVVAAEAAARGYKRLGIMGTEWLVESEVYPRALAKRGLAWELPVATDRALLAHAIMDDLVAGKPTDIRPLVGVIERLKARGCDAVVLGCTELPLVLSDLNSPLPTLDSTRLLARAALTRSRRSGAV